MATDTTFNKTPKNVSGNIKPMVFWKAVLYFGLPALLFRVFLYNITPIFIRMGLSPFEANVVSLTVPSAILFALAFGFYKRDGYPLTWSGIKTRFRLLPMTTRDWLWAIGAFLISFLTIGALIPSATMLIRTFPVIAPPDFFPPWLKPDTNFNIALFTQYIGTHFKGNWGVVILFFIMLFFNITGEEMWWRGYILPRQEKVHSRWTWLVHGLLWLCWHLTFYPWQAFALLPICLILPYVAQRRQNTWVALIIHLQNGIVLLLILAAVLGIAR
jgi:membrane protease YdiL (CAAX protease family)